MLSVAASALRRRRCGCGGSGLHQTRSQTHRPLGRSPAVALHDSSTHSSGSLAKLLSYSALVASEIKTSPGSSRRYSVNRALQVIKRMELIDGLSAPLSIIGSLTSAIADSKQPVDPVLLQLCLDLSDKLVLQSSNGPDVESETIVPSRPGGFSHAVQCIVMDGRTGDVAIGLIDHHSKLIDAACKAGDMVEAERSALKMEARGLDLSADVYSMLINGQAQRSSIELAIGWLDRMRAAGHNADVFVYQSILSAIARIAVTTAHRAMALRLFRRCKTWAGVTVCRTVVFICVKTGGYEDAERLYADIALRDLVDGKTAAVMVEAWARMGGASLVVRRLREAGFFSSGGNRKDEVEHLIAACGRAGAWDAAHELEAHLDFEL